MIDNKESATKFSEEVQSLIQFADSKANTLLVVLGIVLSVVLSTMEGFKWFDNIAESIFMILFLVTVVTNIIVLLFKVIKPRYGKTSKSNLMYFNDVAKMSKEDYINKVITQEITCEQEAEQNYNISKILVLKNFWLKICMYILCANIAFMILIFVL